MIAVRTGACDVDARQLAGALAGEDARRGAVRVPRGRRHRRRHGRADAATDLRSVLHDEVHGPRPRPGGRLGIVRGHAARSRSRASRAGHDGSSSSCPPSESRAPEASPPRAVADQAGTGTFSSSTTRKWCSVLRRSHSSAPASRCSTAADGRQALEVLDAHSDEIAAIVLDDDAGHGRRGSLDGSKSAHATVPVVLSSGYTERGRDDAARGQRRRRVPPEALPAGRADRESDRGPEPLGGRSRSAPVRKVACGLGVDDHVRDIGLSLADPGLDLARAGVRGGERARRVDRERQQDDEPSSARRSRSSGAPRRSPRGRSHGRVRAAGPPRPPSERSRSTARRAARDASARIDLRKSLGDRRLDLRGDLVRLVEGELPGELQVERDLRCGRRRASTRRRCGSRARRDPKGRGERALPQCGCLLGARLDVDDDVAPGRALLDAVLDRVGDRVSLRDRRARLDADDDVGEMAPGRLRAGVGGAARPAGSIASIARRAAA